MKNISPLILVLLVTLNMYSQEKVILNESFKAKRFNENLDKIVDNQKNSKVPIADFSFSTNGHNDKASLKIYTKQQLNLKSKKNVKIRLKNIELVKNKTYTVSFWVRSRTGKGRIRLAVYSSKGTGAKTGYATTINTLAEFKSGNDWQKKTFKFKATKKTKSGIVDLKKMALVIGFSKCSRGIYLLDDIKITQND